MILLPSQKGAKDMEESENKEELKDFMMMFRMSGENT